jgi:putative MFS transporter
MTQGSMVEGSMVQGADLVATHDRALHLNIPGRLERLPMTGYQRRIFAVIATAWLVDQVDVALLAFLLGTLTQYFGLSPVEAGFLASMTFLGQLVGNIGAGTASDLFGRRRTFQVTMLIWGAASLAAAASWSLASLMVFRFLIGVGVGGEAPVAQAMVSEFVPAKVRGKYIAFMEGFWAIGFVLSGVISYTVLPILGWRWVFAVVGLLSAVVFIVRRNVPESPRWLADRGRYDEAERVMRGMEAEVVLRTGASLPEPLPARPSNARQQHPLLTLFDSEYRRRTLMACGFWFFALLGNFGLTSWIGVLLRAHGFSIISSVGFLTLITTGGIPGFFAAAYLLEKIGRKPTTALFLVMSAVSAAIYGNASDQTTLFVTGFAMQFFMFGMWSCLYAYTPELFPTSARSTGAGVASAAGRVGAIIGPIVIGYVVADIGQTAVFTLGALSFGIAAVIILVLGVETRGKLLEEISA